MPEPQPLASVTEQKPKQQMKKAKTNKLNVSSIKSALFGRKASPTNPDSNQTTSGGNEPSMEDDDENLYDMPNMEEEVNSLIVVMLNHIGAILFSMNVLYISIR